MLVPFQFISLMSYTYVLHSARDGESYMSLVYDEAFLSQDDAFGSERDVKAGRGKRYRRQRLTRWRATVSPNQLEGH
jgi:hypothetical protein